MNTFYFDTGVKPYCENCFGLNGKPIGLYGRQVWRGGTKQIPFDYDAPLNATFLFACDNPDLGESKLENVIVREIFNSDLLSKYAYFRIKPEEVTEK